MSLQIGDWRARWEALEARKASEALAASIEPFTTELDRPDDRLVPIGNPWSRRLFDGSFYISAPSDDRPAGNLVFVQSRDGDTVAANPSSLGGGEADKYLIYEGLSRAAVDAVLSGAATVRGTDLVLSVWHPEIVALRASLGLPRHPMQIVATLDGIDLDRGLMFNVPQLQAAVITVPRGAEAMGRSLAARPWITPIVIDSPRHLAAAFAQLWRLGVRQLSCIGGRAIAGQLIDSGLIQDVYLTTSPRSAGEPNTPFYAAPLVNTVIVRKHGTGADAGVVFEHLRL